MNPAKKLSNVFRVIGITVAGAASSGLKDALSSASVSSRVAAALSILAIPIISEGLSSGFKWLFEHSRPLRRLLLGGKFVEGTWIEIVKKGNEILSIGIIWFENEEYGIKVHGFNYDLDGNINFHFESKRDLVQIEWPSVQYAYTGSLHVR